MTWLRPLPLVLTAAFALAGCGSDDRRGPAGDSAPVAAAATAAANRAPTFTSGTSATTVENRTGTVYRATASDADGDPLSFSLAGGTDRAWFAITADGQLSFTQPPDFEVPRDSDGNNIYQVRIGVSDGTTSAVRDVRITVTNVGPDAFQVRRIRSGLNQPLFLAPLPDRSGKVLVFQKSGRIDILDPVTGALAARPFLDLTGQVSTNSERGLLGFAASPSFADNGVFFVYLTNPSGTIEVRRYRTPPNSRAFGDPATANVILSIPHPGFSNHNGGWIGFGPDRMLYVATGDGGGSGDPNGNAQNRNVLLGKILRIDPSRDGFPEDALRDYAIPPDNPFARAGGRPEIWVYGLRNPFRASFDPQSGALWIGDVGQSAREEIDRIARIDRGANLGWDVLEGTATFSGTPRPSMFPPVAEYPHGSGPREGNSITGGHVYRGPIEALRGQYVFGDFVTGNLWSLPIVLAARGQTLASNTFILRNADFTPDAGTIDNVSSFGVDEAGNLYIVDYDGEIFRIELR